jgi:hypothetical protein
MKPSRTWFALILIASALLLSAANSGSAQSPSPPKAEVRHRSQRHHDASSSVVATPQNQPSSIATPEETRSYAYNYYYPEKSDVPPVPFQIVTTVLLLLVTGGLWITSIWQWRAIDQQAKIAEEALTMDVRPRISVKIEGGHAPLNLTGKHEQQFVIYYKVRNTGRGPAFVTRQNQCFFYLSDPNDPLPPEPPESPHDTPIGGIITGGDDVPCDVGSEKLSSEKFDRIQQGLTRAFWMVLIEYRDERRQPHVYREPSVYEPGSGRWIYPPNAPDTWSEST